jgi:exosome complex RNA-binding protein Rrp4
LPPALPLLILKLLKITLDTEVIPLQVTDMEDMDMESVTEMVQDMVKEVDMVTAMVVMMDYMKMVDKEMITANITATLMSALRRKLTPHLVQSMKILKLPKLNASSLLMILELKSHRECNSFALL